MNTPTGQMRDWDAGWQNVQATILERDVWLLTDHLKRNYLAPHLAPGARTLEVGCGSAKLSALIATRGARVTGMDFSWHALEAARTNFSALETSGAVLQGNAFSLPFPAGAFDAVLSTGLLEHFSDPLPIVNEMVRVLRPGGIFFSDIAPLKFSLLRMGMYVRGLHRSVADEYPYNASHIGSWLRAAGLGQIQVIASGVVPPLGILRHAGWFRDWCFRHERFWTRFDGTPLAAWFGFFYLAWGIK